MSAPTLPRVRPAAHARDRGTAEPGAPRRGGLLAVSHAVLVLWALVSTLPLLWAVSSALKSDSDIFTNPWALPRSLHWDNFVRAWSTADIGRYFLNSLVVVGGGVALTLLLSSMAAYVLARFTFHGNRIVYYLFVAGLTFPVFLALVPLFFVVRNLGMLSTYHGLILVYTAYSLPFSIFFLTAFFRTLPTSVAEAALIDGASQTRTFFSVMLPMARPGLISIGTFNFIGQWNQYLLPVVLVSDRKHFVISQGLADLAVNQGYKADYGALFAGLTLAMLPVLIVYVVFQRRIQSGLTAGALK